MGGRVSGFCFTAVFGVTDTEFLGSAAETLITLCLPLVRWLQKLCMWSYSTFISRATWVLALLKNASQRKTGTSLRPDTRVVAVVTFIQIPPLGDFALS